MYNWKKIYEWNYMPFPLRWMELQLLGKQHNYTNSILYTCMIGQYRKILLRQQPIILCDSPKQLPAIYSNKGLLTKYSIFAFPRLTFMCQNKYLAAMRRNNYRYACWCSCACGCQYIYIYIIDWAKGLDCKIY
jgi:hypothetical protein